MSDSKKTGADLLVVDNESEWRVERYLRDWTEIADSFDIATGYFEIGGLLALDGSWQKLNGLRILMGDEVSLRTKKAMLEGIAKARKVLDDSLEVEKEKNDFLSGVPAIVEAIKNKKIRCRIYTKDKFHAKAYITHGKQAVVGSAALVGSSNLTLPGLTTNVELNIQLRREVETLQKWFEEHWDKAEEISEDILKVIERHMKLNSIFGLGPVLMPSDIRDLLECQTMPLPRRKSPKEREEQKERIKRDPDRYANQLFAIIAPFVEEKLQEMALLYTTASAGRQPRSASAGHEHRRQPNLNSA